MAKTTKTPATEGNIIINQLVLRTTNRGRKDIADWRAAHKTAESVISTGTRTALYDLYDDVCLDAHLDAIIDKRIMSITNHKIKFMKDDKEVEEVSKIIRSKGFRQMLREIMLAQFWGITVCELKLNADRQLEVYSVPRKHIRSRTGRIVPEQFGDENSGFSYREGMYLQTCIEVGGKTDLGRLLKAVPYVLYKRGCWGDWSQYAEVFGMPTKIGRYAGYDKNTKEELESALDEAGSALSIVIPEEAKLEFLESKSTAASGNLYKDLAAACDEQLSILVLGNTESTKSSKSSGYAQSQTHQGQQEQIAEDDRAYVCGYLETEVRRVFTALGLPMDGGEWQFEPEEEHITLKERCDIDLALKAAGLPIADDYYYEKYGIPKPDNYDALVQETAAKKAAQEKAAVLATKKTPADKQQYLTIADLKDFFDFATPNK